jgi:hypothetical protein
MPEHDVRPTIKRLRALRGVARATTRPSVRISPALRSLLVRRSLPALPEHKADAARGVSHRAIELAQARRPND